MTNYEFWIDITIILLLIPTIFYTASLSMKIGKIEENQNQMAELAQALRHATDVYASHQENKETTANAQEKKSQQKVFKDTISQPLPSAPKKEIEEKAINYHLQTAPLDIAPTETPSEAELELLQAIKSIK